MLISSSSSTSRSSAIFGKLWDFMALREIKKNNLSLSHRVVFQKGCIEKDIEKHQAQPQWQLQIQVHVSGSTTRARSIGSTSEFVSGHLAQAPERSRIAVSRPELCL